MKIFGCLGMFIVPVVFLVSCSSSDRGAGPGVAASYDEPTTTADLTDMSLEGVAPIDFASGKGSVSLEGSAGESLLLVVSSVNTTAGSYTLQLSDTSLPKLATPPQHLEGDFLGDPDEAVFHQYLGEVSQILSETETPLATRQNLLKTMNTPPAIGDTETFRVLSAMSSVSTCEKVTGELRAITDNLLVYVDEEAADHLSDGEIEELANDFDSNAIPLERGLFGGESDINGDGRITILMSGVTNGMSSSGGIVTGFFFPGDLYAASSGNPCSNEREIFFTLVPDPKGKFGTPISNKFSMENILPGVLCHEYQHMISFNRHVLEGKGKPEEAWLNEGLSHLAEDLCGYGLENYSRVKLFLNQPNTTPLIPPTSPTLAERGASYLFLRYLYEQHPDGEGLLQTLLDGEATGINNVLGAYGANSFADLMNRWALTLAVSEAGITSNPLYNYEARSVDPVTGNPTGICVRCEANDGRGTVLDGPAITDATVFPIVTSLKATASQFFLVQDSPSSLGINSAGSPTLTGSILRLER